MKEFMIHLPSISSESVLNRWYPATSESSATQLFIDINKNEKVIKYAGRHA